MLLSSEIADLQQNPSGFIVAGFCFFRVLNFQLPAYGAVVMLNIHTVFSRLKSVTEG